MRQTASLFLLALCAAAPVHADWINLTGAETAPNIAEIHVLDDHVRLALEIYVGDLEKFEDLLPDDWLRNADPARPGVQTRMQRFSEQGFQFQTDRGEKLQGRLQLAEARLRVDRRSPFAGMINPFTRQRVPAAPQDKRVLYAEIIYPFAGRPETLTIIPPANEEGRALASIGFIAYHKAVPVIDFRYLGQRSKLMLDWADPWYSRFENPNLKRHHKSALMSFLYVEPFEVRHEILTRVKDLENWMDLGLRGDQYIELDELDPLRQRIGDFLMTKNPVLVDGEALKPILDRSNYVRVGMSGIQLLEKPGRLELSTAIVGVIIAYMTDGMPQQASVHWELFTDQIQQVPATATDPAGALPGFVSPDDDRLVWNNFLNDYQMPTVQQVAIAGSLGTLSVPAGSMVLLAAVLPVAWRLRSARRLGKPSTSGYLVILGLCAGAVLLYPVTQLKLARPLVLAGEMDEAQAAQILQALLKNVYRAFDFREEDDVYDKLALSVEGDLLADIYLQNRRSFAVQKAGGAQAKVKEVAVSQAMAERQAAGSAAYTIRGAWTATGTVGHWGHVHTRTNQYDAIVTIGADQGNWKISGLEVLEEQRIDPAAVAASDAR
jgi:hypothetical protein